MSAELETYRRENGKFAAVTAAAVVLVLTIIAGYLVAQSIRIGDAGPFAIATTRRVSGSVSGLIDERLKPARIQLLLGIEAPAPNVSADTQALQKVSNAQLGMTKAGAASYFATAVSERSGDLERRVAPAIGVAGLNGIRLDASVESVNSKMQRIERRVNDALSQSLATSVTDWARAVADDPALALAWTIVRNPASPAHATLPGFLTQLIAPDKLSQQIAKRVARDLVVSTDGLDAGEGMIKDLSARFAWGTAAIIFVGLCGAAVLVSLWQIWTLLPAGHAGGVLTGTLIVAAVVAGFVLQWPAVSPARIEFFGPILGRHEGELGTWVILLSRLLTAFAAAAVVVMFAAAWASVWVDSKDLVETQLESLRLIFNTGAAALVAGTLQLAVLYGWVVAVLGSPEGSVLERAALSAAGYPGAIFSVALLAIYLPPLAILKARARTVDASLRTQLASQGLSDSAREKFLVLLQALAPLLAALPISGLLSILGQ